MAPNGLWAVWVDGIALRIKRSLFWLVLLGACCEAGCGGARGAPAGGRLPMSRAALAARESFRVAGAKDLQAILIARPTRTSRYPLCTVKVYNLAGEDVIVGYEPLSVVVHCGEYEQRGPPVTFVYRREILAQQQPLEFELPPGGWGRSPTAGSKELLIPTELPSGQYPIWATFRIGGPGGEIIETEHGRYDVP